jgi:hypothetical protein
MEFDLRFTLIVQCGFHQNSNILLQEPGPQELQIYVLYSLGIQNVGENDPIFNTSPKFD